MHYDDDVIDYTECPHCGHKTAEIVEGESGYYATCPACGRTATNQVDTVPEAVAAFKDEDNVEYQ